jgi:hypothetical protein
MGLSDQSSPQNPSQGSGFDVYIITGEQLKALQDANYPVISNTIALIEGQHIGQIRGFTNSSPNEAPGILLEHYRKALTEIASYEPVAPLDNEYNEDERRRENRPE